MNTTFDLRRLGYFIRRQLYMNFSSLWVGIVAIAGLLLTLTVLVSYFRPTESVSNLVNLYGIVFFISGFIFTSRIYSEMHSPQKSYMFLTLPVSAAEKLIGAWLITSPVFVIATSIFISVLMLISALIVNAVAGETAGASAGAFFQSKYLFLNIRDIGAYMVLQTFFLLGAIAFRGNNFLKTLVAAFILLAVLAMYTGGLGYLFFGNAGVGPHNTPAEFTDSVRYIFNTIIPFLFWSVLPLFILLVSFFKLKERQV